MRILLIDNYDSFTFNLVQALGKMGAEIVVHRNDAITEQGVLDLAPDRVVISPGPKGPADAGISTRVIRELSGRVPILGVCLGMQCINEVFGGVTARAPVCVHGKTSRIFHDGQGLYQNIDNPFSGARYHSLVVDRVPAVLRVNAWTEDGVPMGIRHREVSTVGVQFHPESFLTQSGELILKNFLELRF